MDFRGNIIYRYTKNHLIMLMTDSNTNKTIEIYSYIR